MIDLLFKIGKFGVSGLIATSVNYGMYLLLANKVFIPEVATVISYASGALVNFVLQRYFVFDLNRSVGSAFALSMLVSVGGLLIDLTIIHLLHRFPIFGNAEWLIKAVATGTTFFYNFLLKRRVFEGRRSDRAAGKNKTT